MVRGLGRGRPKVVNFLPGEEDSNNPPSAASSSLDAGVAPENMETEMPFPTRKSKNDTKREWDLLLLQQISAYSVIILHSDLVYPSI